MCFESREGRSLETRYDMRLQLVLVHSFSSRFGVVVDWVINIIQGFVSEVTWGDWMSFFWLSNRVGVRCFR